jgi:lysophospholipid acyltransferase (LPLAT)-like uncharacterized protein
MASLLFHNVFNQAVLIDTSRLSRIRFLSAMERSTAVKRTRANRGRGLDGQEVRRRAYRFDDLSNYKLLDRVFLGSADLLLYSVIRVICSTVRWEVRGGEHLEAILAGGRRAIFTFWHVCIFGATWFWRRRGIVVMSSRSRDGEYVARLIKRFGYGTARGSSSRGAGRALAEMAECLDHGLDVAFTIDGPRGPAYVAKTGAVTLARHTGHAILPFHVTPRKYMSLPSWDKQEIPLPFTRAITLVGPPIYVPRDASDEEVQRIQALLQSTLEELRDEGERWRQDTEKITTC